MGTGNYSWLTFAQAKAGLAQRLDDTNFIHWSNVELGLYINEALTAWQALTGYSRARGTFNLSTGVPFYDLTTLLIGGSGNLLLSMLVTDAQVITLMEYMLLEPPTIPWTGTTQFNLNEFTDALQHSRDNFLVETGSVIIHSTVNVLAPPNGMLQLDDHVIDVRRVAWIPATPGSGLSSIPLWMSDEFASNANQPGWQQAPGTPEAFSIVAPPPLQVQLIPAALSNGSCDLLTVNAGAALDPTVGVALGIPTNFVWAVKWGALSSLLSQDGEPRDEYRANYCRQRYEEACELSRMMPVVVTAALNNVQVFLQTVGEFDSYRPTWAGSNGPPDAIGTCGQNMVVVAPPPDANGPYSVTFDVVQNAVVPVADGDFIQVGREFWHDIEDEAEHLALFKSGGSEFGDSIELHRSFVKAAATCNDRLKASSIYLNAIQIQSDEEKKIRPRRETDATEVSA